jgi:hypothetical protein
MTAAMTAQPPHARKPAPMMTPETALAIARTHREIEVAKDLLQKITEEMGRTGERGAPDIRDAFGRLAGGLQLGVPSGENGHRLFMVGWPLARVIIEAHITAMQAQLAALNEKARVEIAGT